MPKVQMDLPQSPILPYTKVEHQNRSKRADLISRFGWAMVGSGKITRSNCGSWRHLTCDYEHENLDHPEKKRRVYHKSIGCQKSSCPICYPKWAYRMSHKANHRFDNAVWKHKILHLTLSPPQNDTNYTFKDARKILKILDKMGWVVLGGFMIRHDWRGRDSTGWKEGLHFHVVYDGSPDRTVTKKFYLKTGWVVKDLHERRSIQKTIGYLMTHASYRPRKFSYSWFGSLSHNKFKAPKMEKPDKITECDVCGRDLIPVLSLKRFKPTLANKQKSHFSYEKWEDWELKPTLFEKYSGVNLIDA